jgi:hypothetical protein
VCGRAYTGEGLNLMEIPGCGRFWFGPDAGAVWVVPDAGVSRAVVDDVYRRAVLPMVLQVSGTQVLHASAVDGPGGRWVLCGRSGTGKSTLAYALSRRGHPLRADDAVAFEVAGGRFVGIDLPHAIRLSRAAASHLGAHQPAPERLTPAGPAAPTPLAALVLLERASEGYAPRPPEIATVEPAEGFACLLTHAYCFSPDRGGARRTMVEHYLELAAAVPILRVSFRPGLEQLELLVDVIEQALQSLRAAA